MNIHSVADCSIINLPKIFNRAGNITPVENNVHVPFCIERIYYIYDIPGGESRGGHAHKALESVIIAISGSFDITIYDGKTANTYHMNRPYFGLNVKPGIWREISNFSSGAICFVLASMKYDELDYIRSYDDYLIYKLNE
jgi:hypothetical protein